MQQTVWQCQDLQVLNLPWSFTGSHRLSLLFLCASPGRLSRILELPSSSYLQVHGISAKSNPVSEAPGDSYGRVYRQSMTKCSVKQRLPFLDVTDHVDQILNFKLSTCSTCFRSSIPSLFCFFRNRSRVCWLCWRFFNDSSADLLVMDPSPSPTGLPTSEERSATRSERSLARDDCNGGVLNVKSLPRRNLKLKHWTILD